MSYKKYVEEALAAVKMKDAAKKTVEKVVAAFRKKVKEILAAAKLAEEKAAATKIKVE